MSRKPSLEKFIDVESGLTVSAIDSDYAYELLSIKCDMLGYNHPLIINIKPFKPFKNGNNKLKNDALP